MLDPLYHLAANAIVFFHKGFAPIFGDNSFFAWAFSVVLLVVCVRVLIFPLFVKQVKSQRTMQMMQPRIKEIREKYGHDKPRMQQEIMALQREHGNPLLGCLPIVLQIPLFISLFHVFTHLAPMAEGPNGSLVWRPRVGLSADEVQQIASAKVFGISLASSFQSSDKLVNFLGVNGTHVKILAIVLIVLMGLTTFLTQRQIMARTGPVDPQQAIVQKVLLYGSPLMLAIFGFRFPIAVLLYWLTTNLWSMGQQFFVIKRMPPVTPLPANGRLPGARTSSDGAPAPARPAPGVRAGAKSKNRPRPAPANAPSLTKSTGAAAGGTAKGSAKAPSTAPPGTRSRSGNAAARAGKGTATAVAGTAADDAGSAAPAASDATAPTATSDGSGTGRKKNAPGKPVTRAADNGAETPSDGTRTGGDGAPRPTPVPAGARRQVGGSRPAKRRGKGKRPGGRR
ncbi:Membrane protein insertase, YidC/Oxa1 family [Frankia canadensis]|uniref:Membrane protein insertase YidC n=1 Tax=Frankia canadensis TaxID=1836972 RepID=A0A2I2L0H8_9ACTN|nr:membrane protein insertase YidC [Frankia canadensis]SNQ51426.1 Membrane protein insertase, YidC/Oxa1 family [Frankia canadensis]SOU58716.1 Membrane protein insertase, YidC/Oxa1 family [Frankia canadensis]